MRQHSPVLEKPILSLIPYDCGSILDVGCGSGSWGYLMKTEKDCTELVGVDVWKPYIEKLAHLKVYDQLVLVKLPFLPFKDKTFDISLASEIIEHLSKHDGLILLRQLERVTKDQLLITTPLNLPQDLVIDGNPFTRHISEWSIADFQSLRFTVKKLRTLPRTLGIVDYFRRLIMRMHKRTIFLIAMKRCSKSNQTPQ